MDYLGICLGLRKITPSQYADYDFNSLCKFGDSYLGANENGIFELEGEDDDGVDITSFFEVGITDFGIPNQKQIRSLKVGYEADEDLILTVVNDDWNSRSYTLTPVIKGKIEGGLRVPVGRDGKGRYWMFKVENTDGCYFAVDGITARVIFLGVKAPQWIWRGVLVQDLSLECEGTG